MGIVRETYHRCLKVRQILRTHLIKFEEKDVFMSREVQKEIRERMNADEITVPQVFVEGIHVGVSILSINYVETYYFPSLWVGSATRWLLCFA